MQWTGERYADCPTVQVQIRIAATPDEVWPLVSEPLTLIGTEAMVRERLAVWSRAGVDTVRLYPAGEDAASKLDNPARGIEYARAV